MRWDDINDRICVMKKISLALAAAAILAVTSSAYADDMPYFGVSPYHGSYWNGPSQDYDLTRPQSDFARGAAQHNSFASGAPQDVRAAHRQLRRRLDRTTDK
jgi:hypothetical protein